MSGTDGGFGLGMGLGMWIFWILLIVIIVALVKIFAYDSGSPPDKAGKTPMEILSARYARGEIDDEEFEHMRRELENR